MIVIINTLSAEFALRPYHYRPTGDYGAYFKPTFSAEFGDINPYKKRFRSVALVTILNMRPTMNEFPRTGVVENSNGTIVYPGTQSFKFFLMLQAHAGYDFAFVKKEKLSAFMGTSLIAGGAFIHYLAEIKGVRSDEGYVTGSLLGFQLRLGGEYKMTERYSLFLSACRNYYRMFSADVGGNYWANDYGVGVIYKFKKNK